MTTSRGEGPPVGIGGLGVWVPPMVVSAAQLEVETGIPAQILEERMGIRQVYRAGAETVAAGLHYLDVPGLEHMKERLDAGSIANFCGVVAQALRKSRREAATFLAPVHMKRSMYERLKRELGIERGFYLEDYGHMQAADQFVILERARAQHLLREGDIVVPAAAGVGYTWSAAIVSWGEREGG